MKQKLLKLLTSAAGGVVSGEEISRELGISRVSVWKHIKKLQELDYQIAASPVGYRLLAAPDALYPWEFGEREPLIHYLPEVESTMLTAKQLAQKGAPGFSVVVAEKQLKGRGRLQRAWHSEQGGLYFTLILRPSVPAIMVSRYSFAASLCLVLVLQKELGVEARVKWPNDILINEKKVCGMLAEMEVESDLVSFLNIGIGLNVNNNPGLKEPNSIALAQVTGKPVSRKRILEGFLNRLETELALPALDHIIPQWKQHTITLNRKVRIVTTTETWEGLAVDIDEDGALLLQLQDQTLKKVYYGDCFLQN